MRARHILIIAIATTSIICGCKKTAKEKETDAQSLHLLAERYHNTIGEPNSPNYNETQYIEALVQLLKEPALSQADSIRADFRLRMCLKNRPGAIATDFNMEFSDGRSSALSKIDCENLIMVFYDPECSHCTSTLKELGERLLNMKVDVLAVYTERNEEVWRASIAEMPKDWRVAIDRDSIVDRELYSIPAMPTIYLLGRDKRIILKDPNINELMDFLIGDDSNPYQDSIRFVKDAAKVTNQR